MEVVVVDSKQAGSSLVGGAIADLVNGNPEAVLGLATGSTPLGVYDDLVSRYEAGEISFAKAKGFALDEYVGLPDGHPESYRAVIKREIADRVDYTPGSVHGPDGWASDIAAACTAYEDAIVAAGGIDLQILGVGSDGHIGFNEPISSLASLTRIKTLTEQTRVDNARFFDDDLSQVPTHVLTQGVGTILRARHLVLLAWGEGKAEAIRATVEGPITSMVPSTALQLHRHATIVVDEGAASLLSGKDHYKWTFENKPAWQGI